MIKSSVKQKDGIKEKQNTYLKNSENKRRQKQRYKGQIIFAIIILILFLIGHGSYAYCSVAVFETDCSSQKSYKTEKGYTYRGIYPGDVLEKKPTIVNDGSNDTYVIAEVEYTNYSFWKKALRGTLGPETMMEGFDDSLWSTYQTAVVDEKKDRITYTYALKKKLTPGESVILFTAIRIPEYLECEDMMRLADFAITIKARPEPNR